MRRPLMLLLSGVVLATCTLAPSASALTCYVTEAALLDETHAVRLCPTQ